MFGKVAILAAALALPGCGKSFGSADFAAKVEDAHHSSDIVRFASVCEDWDDWDKPTEPFQIHGNSWYVGTCGISAILITTSDGHALIDSGTVAGADIVLANIRALGIDPKDIKLLATSHEHFDHVGGMAKIQQVTGADVISSEIGIDVLASGEAHPDDPQFGMHEAMARITHGMPYFWGDAPYRLDYFGLSPIATPGHTPGALSWTWRSCAGEDCRTIVYADSLSPVSRDDYRFSDHRKYLAAYRDSIAAIAKQECDILLTPHPSASNMLERAASGSFEGGMTCAQYADAVGKRLDQRLAVEAAKQ